MSPFIVSPFALWSPLRALGWPEGVPRGLQASPGHSLGAPISQICNENQCFSMISKIALCTPAGTLGLLKGSPRAPQELPKTPQGPPRDPQGPPKDHPGSPKETPGTPRDPPAPPRAPLGSPWASLGCPRGSWEPKIRPKWCPRAPKDNAIIKNEIRITEVIRIIMPFSH